MVVGLEPDDAYEGVARRDGAGAWLARDRVAKDLSASMRLALVAPVVLACPGTIGKVESGRIALSSVAYRVATAGERREGPSAISRAPRGPVLVQSPATCLADT